jgi:hypothetical protein
MNAASGYIRKWKRATHELTSQSSPGDPINFDSAPHVYLTTVVRMWDDLSRRFNTEGAITIAIRFCGQFNEDGSPAPITRKLLLKLPLFFLAESDLL